MRRSILIAALAIGGTLVLPGTAFAGGPPSPSFYVDGTLYRTIGTPTDLSGTGAPDASFDTIYQFFGAQPYNVATAAPGDAGYNGGRWQVHGLSFPGGYDAALESGDLDHDGVIDTEAEVLAAIRAGDAVDVGIVKWFVCPVIPVGGR